VTDLYLLAADRTCSAQSLVEGAYRGPTKEAAAHFLQANAFAGPQDRLMRGELYAVPGLASGPRVEAGQVGRAVAKANYQTRNQRSEPAAAEFNANFHWLYEMIGSDEGKAAAKTAENTLDYFEKRTEKIVHLFEDYERAYKVSAGAGADFLKGSAANSARRFVERDLQDQLTGVSRKMFLERPHRARLQDQLGISHKALKNQVKVGSNLKELDKVAQAAGKSRKLAGHLKKGGLLIKAVGLVSTGAEIKSAFDTGGRKAGSMKLGEESFKLAGSLAGGRVGGAVGGWAAGAAVAFFGVGTGGLGFVAIAIGGLVVGSMVGGEAGEVLGEMAWGEWGDGLYTIAEDSLGLAVKTPVQ
jgi:hypothetical protein